MVKNSDKSIKAIGDEMKAMESRLETRLPPEGYVVIRVDGRAFHTLTRRMEKPFDPLFVNAMNAAAASVLEAVGAEFTYVQSDEITAVLSPYGRKADVLPFNGRLEKLVTVAASAAASGFTRALMMGVMDDALAAGEDGKWITWTAGSAAIYSDGSPRFYGSISEHAERPVSIYVPTVSFDARAIHVEDLTGVADNLLWRRVDCRKNAVSAAAQAEFSDRELHEKSTAERWQMLADKHGGDFKIDDGLYWGRLLSTGDVPVDLHDESVNFSRRLLSKHADDLPEKWREQALSSERVRGLKVLPATKENTEWVLGRLEAREQWSPSA